MSDKKIHIKIDKNIQCTSKIKFNEVTHIIHTEEQGDNSSKVYSRVFLKGKIIYEKASDFSHLIGLDAFKQKLSNFIKQSHKSTIHEFSRKVKNSHKKEADYINGCKYLLKKGQYKDAFNLLKEGIEIFPDDPVLLSFYGFLCSYIERRHNEGVRICREAISKLGSHASISNEFLYPILYLNLGRAYLGANKKKEAIKTFNKGLKTDPTNADIVMEMNKIGRRREPVLPFLKRNNPINKQLGILMRRTKISKG
jgi:tetratricopeptide (TPR) repeat protein